MKRTAIAAAIAALIAGTAYAGDTEFILYKQTQFRGQSQVIDGEVANLEGGFAGEGSSAVVKGGYWEVCTEDHFQGNCYVIAPGKYPRLRGLDDRIVAVRFLGDDQRHAKRAMTYDDERFARREAREERREARQERREERREARWARGAVDLYARPDFRGRSVRIEENVPNLGRRQLDGRASSVVVHEGVWQMCTEPGFEGRCGVFRPGQYDRLAVLDDRVSSLRQIR